ncbi:hypothetical protein [Roseiconus lacunae]|uniref:hypothetical protein n=1 Tax=Roseiconus lacunae TaxID=2605694 RepID=UPI001E4613D2|nr:hypothetical protein [Roseiconus lacunae]MCD0460037.1 hypothetical protein [Roseiconus lacunae]
MEVLKPWCAGSLAKTLNGCESLEELDDETAAIAKANGLLVIFGRSDDLVHIGGAFDDEVSAWDGAAFQLDRFGLRRRWGEIDTDDIDAAREYFQREPLPFVTITAEWCKGNGYAWTITADCDSCAFDVFDHLDDHRLFCRGIVIDIRLLDPVTNG